MSLLRMPDGTRARFGVAPRLRTQQGGNAMTHSSALRSIVAADAVIAFVGAIVLHLR